MSLVIFDTEFTSWQGCLEKGWTGSYKKEIVQIAAVKVTDKLEVVAEFNVLCKPVINPVLSDYFVDLTHITNEQINVEGILFREAYDKFVDFTGDDICYSHRWGSDFENKSDGAILEENISLYKLSLNKRLVYKNIAAVFQKLYLENNIKVAKQSSGEIARILGLEQKLQELGHNPHYALYDVYSILEGLKYFYPGSIKLIKKLTKQAV